jgi:hypothetical protein
MTKNLAHLTSRLGSDGRSSPLVLGQCQRADGVVERGGVSNTSGVENTAVGAGALEIDMELRVLHEVCAVRNWSQQPLLKEELL